MPTTARKIMAPPKPRSSAMLFQIGFPSSAMGSTEMICQLETASKTVAAEDRANAIQRMRLRFEIRALLVDDSPTGDSFLCSAEAELWSLRPWEKPVADRLPRKLSSLG